MIYWMSSKQLRSSSVFVSGTFLLVLSWSVWSLGESKRSRMCSISAYLHISPWFGYFLATNQCFYMQPSNNVIHNDGTIFLVKMYKKSVDWSFKVNPAGTGMFQGTDETPSELTQSHWYLWSCSLERCSLYKDFLLRFHAKIAPYRVTEGFPLFCPNQFFDTSLCKRFWSALDACSRIFV